MNKFNFKNLTPFKWFVLENFPFIEADFDALTEWQLFCKLGKEINKIIESQNTVGTEMENLSQAFIELQNYVNNYFDNLDVQEEINNKLNDMAEQGLLQQYINEFLRLNAMLCFNTVADMLANNNLINGSYAKTLGFYTINDGGSAMYKIRSLNENEEVDNTFTFLTNNNLVAELIIKDKTISLLEIGCKSDNTENCDTKIYKAISKLQNGGTLFIPTGKYLVSHIAIDFDVTNLNIVGQGFESTLYNNTTAWTIEFLNKVVDLYIDNMSIWCNNNAYGIKFTKPIDGNNGRIRINNITIRNCRKGIYAHSMVYFDMKCVHIGVTNTNSDNNENYAMDYDGYEYNSFDTCSFNANSRSDFPLVILHQANWLNFFNCEFAYGGIGLLFDTENTTSTSGQININNCKLYNLTTGIELKISTKAINVIKIIQNTFYNKGLVNTERFLKVTTTSNQKVYNLMVENNSFNKVLNESMSYAIECDDDTLSNSAFINNQSNYNTANYMKLNNNIPTLFSDFNAQRIRTQNITGNGSTTVFTLYNGNNQLPILPRTPLFAVNIPDLNIPYSVKTYYESSNPTQLRGQIIFTTPPPAGTYAVNYQLIY